MISLKAAVRQARRALWAAIACAPLLTAAQGAPARSEPTSPVRFRSLDVHERQEAIGDILERLARERDTRREEHRAYIDVVAEAQALPGRPDDDAKLAGAMALSAALAQLDSQMRDGRLRRLAVLDRIQAETSRAEPLSAEGMRLLRETDREVRQMLAQQEDQARRLGATREQLRRFVDAVPPPAGFVGKAGVAMRLAGRGQDAFYVSAAPVPVDVYQRFLQSLPDGQATNAWARAAASTAPDAALTGLSWSEASRFCQWLSAQEGVPYRLPTATEAQAIAAQGVPARLAFWGADAWESGDHTVRRDMRRFGVAMVTVWDPDARLGATPGSFGDVPFARYRDLALLVVTARQTGVTHRWQRLKASSP